MKGVSSPSFNSHPSVSRRVPHIKMRSSYARYSVTQRQKTNFLNGWCRWRPTGREARGRTDLLRRSRIPSPVAVGQIKCLIHKPLQVALACQRSTRLQIRDIRCSVKPLIVKASTQLLKFPANELNPSVSTACRYLRHAFHILIHSICEICRKIKPDPAISSKDYNCS